MKTGLGSPSIVRIGAVLAFAVWTMLTTSGCASLMASGPRKIPIASQPAGAKVSIYNRSNELVTVQTTPFVAQLSPRYRFFQGQRYRIVFEMEGYESAEAQLNPRVGPWYLGNLLVGLAGFLIIDPATGAMFRLEPDELDQMLTPLPSPTPTTDTTPAPEAEAVPAPEAAPVAEPAAE